MWFLEIDPIPTPSSKVLCLTVESSIFALISRASTAHLCIVNRLLGLSSFFPHFYLKARILVEMAIFIYCHVQMVTFALSQNVFKLTKEW